MHSVVQSYVFRKASAMSLASLASLVLLTVVSELFGKLSTFAEYGTGLAVIMQYLAYSIPQMVYWVLPFSVCLGILAAQAAFSRHSEIIAMQACSVPRSRIYAPYLAVGLLATVLMAATSFYLFPAAQRQADRIEDLKIKRTEVTGSFSVSGGRFRWGRTSTAWAASTSRREPWRTSPATGSPREGSSRSSPRPVPDGTERSGRPRQCR